MPTSHTATERARSYAEGLYRWTEAEEVTDLVGDQLYRLQGLIEANPELRAFLKDATIRTEGKREAMQRILAERVHPLVLNFLLTLVDNGRGGELEPILTAFLAVQAARRGELEGELASAVPLTAEEIQRIEQRLSAVYRRTVHLRSRQDPSLLGGVQVRVGQEIIDGSLRRRLEQMRSLMLQRS